MDRLEHIAYRNGLRAVLNALLTKYDDYCTRVAPALSMNRIKLSDTEYAQAILDCIAIVETFIKDEEMS